MFYGRNINAILRASYFRFGITQSLEIFYYLCFFLYEPNFIGSIPVTSLSYTVKIEKVFVYFLIIQQNETFFKRKLCFSLKFCFRPRRVNKFVHKQIRYSYESDKFILRFM